MEYSIQVSDLKKNFPKKGKDLWALKGLDLKVKKGEIFGILGPNGAGKTTTIYILTTLLKPTSGSARIMGYDVVRDHQEVRKRIGLCMGGTNLYWDLNAREILEYYGRLAGMDKEKRNAMAEWLIESLDIAPFRKTVFADLSTGMRQKIAVAKSLLNEPDVLFLDEPTSGLDVEVAQDIRDFIFNLVKERKMTVILTSHILYEVEEMCDRITVIKEGKNLITDTIPQIRKRMGFPDVIKLYLDKHSGVDFLKDIDGVLDVDNTEGVRIEVVSAARTLGMITSALRKRRFKIKDIEVRKSELKDMFLKMVKEDKHVE